METERLSTLRAGMIEVINDSENRFFEIASILSGEDKNIITGNMMSSPGIKYKNKVIAFYHQNEMVIRLGKGADLKSLKINNPKFLNPFKHKPPMTGWICFSYKDHERWEKLCRVALDVMKSEIDH